MRTREKRGEGKGDWGKTGVNEAVQGGHVERGGGGRVSSFAFLGSETTKSRKTLQVAHLRLARCAASPAGTNLRAALPGATPG